MNIKLSLNDLMLQINRAKTSGKIKEAISLIETNFDNLESYERNIVQNVKEYLQKKFPHTAYEASARAQVEMSLQLNKVKNLFSRITKDTILSDVKTFPEDRSDWSMLRENLNSNLSSLIHPQGRDFWLSKFLNGEVDGLTGKGLDLRFMEGAQRLVDLGIIDKSTLVIIHTGHNIPIASKLMENSDKLGKVTGVLEFSRDSFPIMGEDVAKIIEDLAIGKSEIKGLKHEDIIYLREKIKPLRNQILYGEEHKEKLIQDYKRFISENTLRISSQAYTYPGTLSQKTEGKGTKFLGIDFHRSGRIDITKLPTAKELKDAGINKVVFLEEAPPLSSFNSQASQRLYEPLSPEKVDKIAYYFDSFVKNFYQQNIKEGLQDFAKLEKILTPQDIDFKIISPTSQEILEAKSLVEKGTFGYKVKHVTRGDIIPYLEKLQEDMPLIVEGVDVNKLEQIPKDIIPRAIDAFAQKERANFENYLQITDIIADINRSLY